MYDWTWEQGLHGAGVDPRTEEASLLYDSRIDLLCCSVSIHLKGTWETQNHQTFCMRLVLVSFTLHVLIYSCMSRIIIETLHDQYFSLTSGDSLRDSKPQVPLDQGTVMTSQCMKLVLVSCLRGVHVLREALVISMDYS